MPKQSSILPPTTYRFNRFKHVTSRRDTLPYKLVIRQQPQKSRMCGIGDKSDRRPIDPPPILQLVSKEENEAETKKYLHNPYYFMYASLMKHDEDEECHLLPDFKTKTTTGSVVSSLYHFKDLDGEDGAYFIFSDLSVRTDGKYRLKFSLFEIIGKKVYHCDSVISDVFTVYTAKKFPGMEESTSLTKCFQDQGLKIRIRKEIRPKRKNKTSKASSASQFSPASSPRSSNYSEIEMTPQIETLPGLPGVNIVNVQPKKSESIIPIDTLMNNNDTLHVVTKKQKISRHLSLNTTRNLPSISELQQSTPRSLSNNSRMSIHSLLSPEPTQQKPPQLFRDFRPPTLIPLGNGNAASVSFVPQPSPINGYYAKGYYSASSAVTAAAASKLNEHVVPPYHHFGVNQTENFQNVYSL